MAEYIERGRLKEAISADCQHLFSFDTSFYDMVMIDIDEVPAADVAPVVHGRWEWITEARYRCSNCGRITQVDECMGKPMYSGCPYCRAKMDLGDCP